MSKSTVSDRFNAFHLEVSVISERMGWVLSHLGDEPGISILQALHTDLERLLDNQDCRDDVDIDKLRPGVEQGITLQAVADAAV